MLVIQLSCVRNQLKTETLKEVFQEVAYNQYISKQVYDEHLEVNINNIDKEDQRLLALLKLSYYFLLSNPELSLQYLHIAKQEALNADTIKIIKLAELAAYFQLSKNTKDLELNLKNLDINIMKASPYVTINSAILNLCFFIYMKYLFQIQEYSLLISLYKHYSTLLTYQLKDHKILALMVLAYNQLQMHTEYLQSLEDLASFYPQSKYSIWAFNKLQALNKDKKYYYSLAFLHKLSFNISVDNSLSDFILDVLQKPITISNNIIRKLSLEEQINFVLKLKLPQNAYEYYINKLNGISVNNKSPTITANYLLLKSDLFNAAGELQKAQQPLEEYIRLYPQGVRINMVKVKLARIYKKQREYNKAANIYEELFFKNYATHFTSWEYFLCTYLSQNYQKALQILNKIAFTFKNKISDAKLDPLIFSYWYGNIQEKLNNTEDAKKAYLQILQQNPYSYYAYLIYTLKNKFIQKYDIKPIQLALLLDEKAQSDTNNNYVLRIDSLDNGLLTQLKDKIPINPLVINALISVESSFKHNAISNMGAIGLMQIIPTTSIKISQEFNHQHLFNISDLFNSSLNIAYGTYYLSLLNQRYNNNFIMALAAYNAGENKVNEWIKYYGNLSIDEFVELIPYKETRQYVKKVISAALKNIKDLDLIVKSSNLNLSLNK